MGFDFVNTRIVGGTGPVSVSSGSVAYTALNANLTIATVNTLGQATSGTLLVRNGLIINTVGNFTSSAQSY